MSKVYKIQNAHGKFSTGGFAPDWTSQGKVWRSLAAVKSHVTQVVDQEYVGFVNPYGAGVRVVEYILAPARLFDVSESHLIN